MRLYYYLPSIVPQRAIIYVLLPCVFLSVFWTTTNKRTILQQYHGNSSISSPLSLTFDSSTSHYYNNYNKPNIDNNNKHHVLITVPDIKSSYHSAFTKKEEKIKRRGKKPNYGDLHYKSLVVSATTTTDGSEKILSDPADDRPSSSQLQSRIISAHDKKVYENYRQDELQYWDDVTMQEISWREPDQYDHYEELDYPRKCYRPKWSYALYPSCNTFHETITFDRPYDNDGSSKSIYQNYNISYIARGHFRETWLMSSSSDHTTSSTDNNTNNDFVLKTNRYHEDRKFNAYTMTTTQIEAITMLQTAASKLTTNIYGHCASSIMVEKGQPVRETIRPHLPEWKRTRLIKKQRRGETTAKYHNNLTPKQKLKIAMFMAESLAEMHGNEAGPIANHDLSLDQYLFVTDKDKGGGSDGSSSSNTVGRIKLNDFNKAKILRWNRDKHKYCTFYSSQHSVYRAPEEFVGSQTDESIDINSLGKLLYGVLTGLRPYYERETEDEMDVAARAGDMLYVDPRYRLSSSSNRSNSSSRSIIESRLVTIMEKCYQAKRKNRASVFEVVQDLRDTAHQVYGDNYRDVLGL